MNQFIFKYRKQYLILLPAKIRTLKQDDASFIYFSRTVIYGIRVIETALNYALAKRGIGHFKIFQYERQKIDQ